MLNIICTALYSNKPNLAEKHTMNEMIDGQIISIIGSLIGVPLAIVTIIVIKDYAKTEKILHEIVQEGVQDRENELEN